MLDTLDTPTSDAPRSHEQPLPRLRATLTFLDARLPAHFWSKVQPCPMTSCWIWTGAATPSRGGSVYGQTSRGRAHRVSYAALHGAIASELTIDHLCRVTLCVNPAHLEAVSARENVMRGNGVCVRNAAKTHCNAGHPLDGDNLRIEGNGARRCRTCVRERQRPRAVLTKFWTVEPLADAPPRIRFEYTVGDRLHISTAEACFFRGERSYIILDGELAESFDADLSDAINDRLHYVRTDAAGHESGDEARAAFEAHYDRDLGADPVLIAEVR